MSDSDNPILFGTEKDVAWAAWQSAFDAGPGTLLPDRAKFEKYFDEAYRVLAEFSLRDRMNSAWNSGVLDRNEQGTSGFNSWWQKIVDESDALQKK